MLARQRLLSGDDTPERVDSPVEDRSTAIVPPSFLNCLLESPMLPIDQFNAMTENQRDAVRQWAQAALEGQEKLALAQIDTLQELIKLGGETFKESCADVSSARPTEMLPRLMMSQMQRGTALNLGLIGMGRRVQQEMACIVEENLRALRAGTQEVVERYAEAARDLQAEPQQRRRASDLREAA